MEIKRIIALIVGIFGLGSLIILHEFGHFIACKLFGVATPVFSIGFGPTLFGVHIGTTFFQIALLPLGGYVTMEKNALEALAYLPALIIILAGVFVNIVFAFSVFFYVNRYKPQYHHLRALLSSNGSGFVGPIGIIRLLTDSLYYNRMLFLYILGVVSLNLGIFNLLPIPMLDGGQIVSLTVRHLVGPTSQRSLDIINFITFLVLLGFIALLSTRDILRLRRK